MTDLLAPVWARITRSFDLEDGQAMAEYALVLALIAVAVAVTLGTVSGAISGELNKVVTALK